MLRRELDQRGRTSTPEDVRDFLRDYEAERGELFDGDERKAATAAAAWILAFNARWQLALHAHGHHEDATIALVRERQEDYLSLTW